MDKASNFKRFRSPDGLKSSVFKAIRNAGTIIEDNVKNVQCPVARIDDELEIADYRIFANNEINKQQKSIEILKDKNNHESTTIFSSTDEPLLGDAFLTVQWIQACSTGDLRKVGKLIKEKPYLISYAPAINHGFSGLHYAAKDGQSSVVRFLVMNGADVNLRTASGYTPLHLAAISKQLEIISILLRDCGANASIEDYSGNTYQYYLMQEQGNDYNQIKNENIIRSNKYELQQNDVSSTIEMTQFPRLKSFRKAVHGRMRFFTDK